MMMAFGGCEENECPIIGYYMGTHYELNSCDVQVDIDENEEEFVFDYIDKDPNARLFFVFTFTYNNLTHLRNSPEFDYVDDDGNELVFDEDGYSRLNGDQIIHISYHHANEEIKSVIASKKFSVSFGFGSFRMPAEQ